METTAAAAEQRAAVREDVGKEDGSGGGREDVGKEDGKEREEEGHASKRCAEQKGMADGGDVPDEENSENSTREEDRQRDAQGYEGNPMEEQGKSDDPIVEHGGDEDKEAKGTRSATPDAHACSTTSQSTSPLRLRVENKQRQIEELQSALRTDTSASRRRGLHGTILRQMAELRALEAELGSSLFALRAASPA
eukprot:gene19762-50177_t